jgi:hypothetical protein
MALLVSQAGLDFIAMAHANGVDTTHTAQINITELNNISEVLIKIMQILQYWQMFAKGNDETNRLSARKESDSDVNYLLST